MGRRTSSETIAKIIMALLERRTWTQAALARRVDVKPRTIRTQLLDLLQAGVPLEREEDHPHVYWSVPRGWFPGGHVLDDEQIAQHALSVAPLPIGRFAA